MRTFAERQRSKRLETQTSRGWCGSTMADSTQIGDSVSKRRVGGKIIPREANALHTLSELLQQVLPGQCVAASGSDQSHGENIRLQFVFPGVGANQQLLAGLA